MHSLQPEIDLDLIMPVYNEAENILQAIAEIHRKIPSKKKLYIVYDFEGDSTVPVVKALQQIHHWIVLVPNKYGRGVINAIKSGFESGSSEVLLVTMADLSDDLTCVPQMVDMIQNQGYDVVAGSRYMKGGQQIGGPPLKRLLSRLAGLSLYWFGALPIHDATNAFRAYRRSWLAGVQIESTGGFEISLELTVKAKLQRRKIGELPTIWRDRTSG